jgi:phosphate transport system permease protein
MSSYSAYPYGDGLLLDEQQAVAVDEPRVSDARVERWLGAVVVGFVGLLLAVVVVVAVHGWPSFAHNGLAWFSSDGNVDEQFRAIDLSGQAGGNFVWTFHAWPLLWSTILITGGAVGIALISSLFVAVFIVEFAPIWMRDILQPVVRLLASVPSVIYGLIGVLVIVPFIGNHLITDVQKASVAGVISLSGYSLLAATLILSLMVAPIMISIFSDGLRSVRPGWIEGSLALGVNRWRTIWKIGVRTARPAIVAGTVLAVARALGEAVMLAMVSGSVAFSPNPADGLIFVYEPSRPLAPTIIKSIDSLGSEPANATIYAIATVLLFSAAMSSLIGRVARNRLRRQSGMS